MTWTAPEPSPGLTGEQLVSRPIASTNLSLRFTYVHMIAEYARHNGHADLLREALDGATGR